MKTAFIIFTIFSFVGIVVFGFAAMNHSGGHNANGCIASATKGIDCKDTATVFDFALFHISVFKSFSTAVLSGNFISVILLFFAFMFFVRIWRKKSNGLDVSQLNTFLIFNARSLELFFSSVKRDFNHWLALHENSPSMFV